MTTNNVKVQIKTSKELQIMREGGKKLATVKSKLSEAVKEGVNAEKIENLAVKMIKKEGGKPSFKTVPDYYWATCVNINEGVVHGIPKDSLIFKKGDVVSVDVGMFYKGFHTDTSFTVGVKVDDKTKRFIDTGKKALVEAIKKARPGNRIYDISESIESVLLKAGYKPVRALVGHGVGRELHEDPQIPCFTSGNYSDSPIIDEGAVIAIEVMYTMGSPNLVLDEDGWTISTADGKIAGLFEETVAVIDKGPKILT